MKASRKVRKDAKGVSFMTVRFIHVDRDVVPIRVVKPLRPLRTLRGE